MGVWKSVKGTEGWVVAHFEFLVASSLVDGVIPSTSSGQALSVAVLQAERRACPEQAKRAEGISRYDAECDGRSLGPLVKTRALGMTPREIRIQTERLRKASHDSGHYDSFNRGDGAAYSCIILNRFNPFPEGRKHKVEYTRINSRTKRTKTNRPPGNVGGLFFQGRIVPTEGKFRQNFLAKSYEPKNRGVK